MKCERCGTENNNGNLYCVKCGNKLRGKRYNIIIIVLIVLVVIIGLGLYLYFSNRMVRQKSETSYSNTVIDEANKRTEQYNFLAYYEGYWYSDEDNNQIIISQIDRANPNEFTFDWCFYKGNYAGIIYNLKATMINDNTAVFSTDENDSDEQTWAGADGIIKFENNTITLNITNSQCYYIGDGLSFIYTNHDNDNKEYFEHLDTKGAYLEYYKKKYVE